MKYSYPQIVLQEVPDEISLALSISGCDLHCKGCHSQETWDPNFGFDLSIDELGRLIKEYKHISCVLFYGGEWDLSELTTLIKEVKLKGLKVALYTGRELNFFDDTFIKLLDYIKVGPYIEKLGPLGSDNTNQNFIKLKD